MAALWILWRKWLCISREEQFLRQFSKCNAGWYLWKAAGPPQTRKDQGMDTEERRERHIKLPLHFSWPDFWIFFNFSHFLIFSVTAIRIFVQIMALFLTGRWQCGSHFALSPVLVKPLTEKLSCTISRIYQSHYHLLGQTEKTIINYRGIWTRPNCMIVGDSWW